MVYEIRVAEAEGIAELRFHGRGDHDEHVAARDQVFEDCRNHMISRVLVDIRDAVMDMSARELFEFGKSMERAHGPRNIRFAVIIRENDSAPYMAAAVAMANKIDIRLFLAEEDARNWLMK